MIGAAIEVLVKFADGYTVCHPLCDSPMVAQARVTAWLMRYPAASTREFTMRREVQLVDPRTGDPLPTRMEKAISVVVIDTKETATQEIRDLCALID
jgi:hypothetical protein